MVIVRIGSAQTAPLRMLRWRIRLVGIDRSEIKGRVRGETGHTSTRSIARTAQLLNFVHSQLRETLRNSRQQFDAVCRETVRRGNSINYFLEKLNFLCSFRHFKFTVNRLFLSCVIHVSHTIWRHVLFHTSKKKSRSFLQHLRDDSSFPFPYTTKPSQSGLLGFVPLISDSCVIGQLTLCPLALHLQKSSPVFLII